MTQKLPEPQKVNTESGGVTADNTLDDPIRRRATSIDVARHAGVSQSAVSRAYSDNASISNAMRTRILASAKALNYRPNRIPGIMLSGRSNMIGVVVGGLSNPFYARTLELMSDALQQTGFQILLVHIDDGLTLDNAIDQLASYRVDAVITALAIGNEETAKALHQRQLPAICFNSEITGPGITSIASNNHESGVAAAKIMHEAGVKRPVWLAGPHRNAASRERQRGFLEGLGLFGFDPSMVTILQGQDTYDSGFEAIDLHLESGFQPDGIFCSNDLMACGALDAIAKRKDVSCPDDVIVIGYDNIPQAAWHNYNLTTFDQNQVTLIENGISTLDAILTRGSSGIRERIVVDSTLIHRQSTQRRKQP